MVYLPDVVYTLRTELRMILAIILVVVFFPFVSKFVTTHSELPTMAHTLPSLSSRIAAVPPVPAKTPIKTAGVTATSFWPTKGIVTLEFGMPDPPYERYHTGIDIAGPINQPIAAFMPGKVVEIGYLSWGYGIYVILDHGNGLTSVYGHMNAVTVFKGEVVAGGDMIGKEGRTGWATGPHLHFEVRTHGTAVNPRFYVHGNPGR